MRFAWSSPCATIKARPGRASRAAIPESAELRATLRGHRGRINACALSSDGAIIVTAGADNLVKVWDAVTGRALRSLRGAEYGDGVWDCAISADGSVIVAAGDDGVVRMWEAARGAELRAFDAGTGRVVVCAVSADGALVAWGGSYSGQFMIAAARHDQPLALHGHAQRVNCCAFSPDGSCLVTGSDDNTLKLWDVASGRELRTLRGHGHRVNACTVSPDGAFIVSASWDFTLKVWDAQSGAERVTLVGHTDSVEDCGLSADGTLIVSASWDGTIKVWDAASGVERATLEGHGGRVEGCTLSPDGSFIVSAGDDGTVKVWDAGPAAPREIAEGHTRAVSGCAFSPDGTSVATVGDDRTVRIWDWASGRLERTLESHAWAGGRCAISADGRVLVAAGGSVVETWQVASEFGPRPVGEHEHVTSCAVAGGMIVSAGAGKIKLWEAGRTSTLQSRVYDLNDCALSADGTLIVTAGGYDGILETWDTASGSVRRSRHQGGPWNMCCAISEEGRFIVSSDFSSLRVWNIELTEQMAILTGHTDMVRACAVSRDGTLVASVADDRTLRIWDVANRRESDHAPASRQRHSGRPTPANPCGRMWRSGGKPVPRRPHRSGLKLDRSVVPGSGL